MYQPAEDSELMVEFLPFVIRKEHSTSFLDMGCGSGIQSRAAIKAGIKEEEILAVDIDDEALEETAKLGVRTLKSDLFENVKEGEKFVVVGEEDTVILKKVTMPSFKNFDKLLQKTQQFAKDSGITKADVESAIKRARK